MLRARGVSLKAFHEIAAWHASLILRQWGAGDVTADKLLGRVTTYDLADAPDFDDVGEDGVLNVL